MSDGGTPLRQLFASFFVNFDKSALVSGAAAVDGLFGKLAQFGTALAGGAIVTAVAAFTNHVIHQGDELITTAERLSVATEALQEWRYVADLADVSNEELSAGFRLLQRNVQGALEGGAEQAKAFQSLGLSIADLKGADLDAILTKAADGFTKLESPIKRTALAQQLFGRGGAALVPLLSKGSAGIQELKDEFRELGGGLNNETLAAANAADDAFKRLKFSLSSLTSNAVTPFIIGATKVATWLKDLVVSFKKWEKGTALVKAGIIALTAVAIAAALPIIIAWAPLIATTLAWTAALTGAILILDDIITMFEGGQSVIGDWIEETFGIGSTAEVIKTAKEWWELLKGAVTDAWKVVKDDMGPALKDLKNDLKDVGELIKLIVDGFKYLSGLRSGKKDLGDTWLGKVAKVVGFSGKEINNAAPELGKSLGASFAVPGLTLPGDQQPPTFGAGSSGEFGGGGLAIPIPLSASTPSVPVPAGSGGAAQVQQIINLSVAPEAKPDPKLVPMVRRAVTDALDQQARELAAGT